MGKISAILLLAVCSVAVAVASPTRDSKPEKLQELSLKLRILETATTDPQDFLSDLIAQVGNTTVGIAQAIIDIQTELVDIVSPGGEALENEIKFIIEIGGIRLVEIFEPLLIMLSPLFPPPEVRNRNNNGGKAVLPRDLVGDLIEALETLLGVPIHELYAVIETTFLQMDVLRVQLITDIMAVAAKVGPEAVDQVELQLINCVVQIKEEIVPLWKLISQLIPFDTTGKFSFVKAMLAKY